MRHLLEHSLGTYMLEHVFRHTLTRHVLEHMQRHIPRNVLEHVSQYTQTDPPSCDLRTFLQNSSMFHKFLLF